MAENLNQSAVEAEIAELTQKIAEKRKLLEEKSGIVTERDLLKSAVVEHVSATPQGTPATTTQSATPSAATTAKPVTPPPAGKGYLDFMDEESRAEVQIIVGIALEKGLREAAKALLSKEPYIIDAFHDAVTDKLYDELKKRGVLK